MRRRGWGPPGIRDAGIAHPARRAVICCLSAICLLGAVAEPAGALAPPPAPTAPADGATVRRDAPLTFAAEDAAELANVYVNVAASPSVGADGALDGTILDSFDLTGPPPSFSETRYYQSETYFLSVPGTYYWQAVRIDCDYPDCLALGPVRTFEVVAAIEHSGSLPASAGHQVDAAHLRSFRLYAGALPDGVDLGRFRTLAVRSAARWGIGFAGTTTARPHVPADVPDGIPSVGFSPEIAPGVLGLTWTYKKRVYRPGRRICHRRHRRRVCHRGPPRFAGTKIVDEDIELDPNRVWQQGPRYPNLEQFDLETVLLHEFGHFAGNGHVADCVDSPMIAGHAPGDWWHAADDWNSYGCTAATPAARISAPLAADWRTITRVVPSGWRPRAR